MWGWGCILEGFVHSTCQGSPFNCKLRAENIASTGDELAAISNLCDLNVIGAPHMLSKVFVPPFCCCWWVLRQVPVDVVKL
jgi:hypothetical protein